MTLRNYFRKNTAKKKQGIQRNSSGVSKELLEQ